MGLQSLLASASKRPVHGRPIRRAATSRLRVRRDPARSSRHSSDVVWALVERMMSGDTPAAVLLTQVIDEGVSTTSGTRFEKITRKAWKRFGKVNPAVVREGAFAAVTPGRSIVLFGIKKEYKRSDPPEGVMRGYVRRFKIGDTAEYNAYNLVYLGKVTSITAKTVTVKHPHGPRKSVFDIETFNSKNYDLDVAEVVKRNSEWTD